MVRRGETRRVQIEVQASTYSQLEKLQKELGASTMSEMIRSSLKLASVLHDAKKRKDIILREKTSGREERLIL